MVLDDAFLNWLLGISRTRLYAMTKSKPETHGAVYWSFWARLVLVEQPIGVCQSAAPEYRPCVSVCCRVASGWEAL